MSPLILILTLILLAIPIVFLANVAFGKSLLAAPALLVLAITPGSGSGFDRVRSFFAPT
jgi:uncharacterized membrane protein (DUF485 family)